MVINFVRIIDLRKEKKKKKYKNFGYSRVSELSRMHFSSPGHRPAPDYRDDGGCCIDCRSSKDEAQWVCEQEGCFEETRALQSSVITY